MSSSTRARVCVPVCVERADDLANAFERAATVADIVELRLDCLASDAELDAALAALPALLGARTRPVIITFRPAGQGGRRALDAAARLGFWNQRLRPLLRDESARPDFIDVEFDLLSEPRGGDALRLPPPEGAAVILSRHDFAGVPADLEQFYAEASARAAAMRRLGVRALVKLAVRAGDATDCLPVFRLLERARRDGTELIAVAMGEAGLVTRVLAPSRGAFLTFGALDDSNATAPGQPTAAQLRDLYRVHSITEVTRVHGIVGAPVSHSLSPHIHNAAFAARGHDSVFIPFHAADARAFVDRMCDPRTRELEWNLRGLSVTAPHKGAFLDRLDYVEPSARGIGAINTVVVEGGGLRGYNTDAAAALKPLEGLIDLRGARVAVAGAGGAARAVLWSLREAGAGSTVFARNVEAGRAIASSFDAACLPLEGARLDGFDLVVNATPLGTRGAREAESVATAAQLRGVRAAYDLVYNPAETRFLREARAAGCGHAVGGLAMLVAQAALQFELWTNEPAPVAVMRAAAEGQLGVEGRAGGHMEAESR